MTEQESNEGQVTSQRSHGQRAELGIEPRASDSIISIPSYLLVPLHTHLVSYPFFPISIICIFHILFISSFKSIHYFINLFLSHCTSIKVPES